MTLESRLTETLRRVDHFEPSPDLFARVERSLAEDRAVRRRRLVVALVAVVTAIGLTLFSIAVAEAANGEITVPGWWEALTQLVVSTLLMVGLAPNIRRFARGYVDDVFHLSPETGPRLLRVMDLAYFVGFTGVMLADAGLWRLDSQVDLASGLGAVSERLAVFVGLMGVLHVANVMSLPILGLIHNSTVRRHLRRHSAHPPPEGFRARVADRNALAWVIGLLVLAIALALTLGLPGLLQVLFG